MPEQTYDEILESKGFKDQYLKVEPGQSELHPCFFYCSGKYTYFANLIDDIKQDMWHQNRYIKYLNFLLQKS